MELFGRRGTLYFANIPSVESGVTYKVIFHGGILYKKLGLAFTLNLLYTKIRLLVQTLFHVLLHFMNETDLNDSLND